MVIFRGKFQNSGAPGNPYCVQAKITKLEVGFFFFVFDVNLTLAFCHALKGPHKGMVAKGVNSRIKRRCKGVTTSNVSRLCLNHVEKLDTARSSISSSFRSFPEGVAFARGRRRS